MKVGLEVHQQLATGKLFCDCPTELSETVVATTLRQLRATGGENHAVDAAAAFQAARGLRFRYESVPTSCLVELDEEPPHALDPAAVDVALTVARLLRARPLDEIEVMRKIVVDGSNTSGFQRTALVAVDGTLAVGDRSYPILSICLEEDAARKIGEKDGEVTYRLDRLGIPLIEIATGPTITSGAEAKEVAQELGALLRSTGRVRRGIGTIREDLNVSAEGGARVEIKGVQELRLIETYVDGEEGRQRALLAARTTLRAQEARPADRRTVDVAADLTAHATGWIAEALRKGQVARAVRLPGARGTLKPAGPGGERLGRELADRARAAGLHGLVHSDELPTKELGAAAASALALRLGGGANDGFALVVAPTDAVAERALGSVVDRFAAALEGIPGETRDPMPDGRTRYSRPLPGRDRMYPETDVPPVEVTAERLAQIDAHLPESLEARRRRLAAEFGLGAEITRQLDRGGHVDAFEELVRAGHPPALVARLLTQDLPETMAALARDDEPSSAALEEILAGVRDGRYAKEAMPTVLRERIRGGGTVADAVARAGVTGIDRAELHRLAVALVARNGALVAERGTAAFAGLMGDLMKEVRGRRDGKEVAEVLRDVLSAAIAAHGTAS